MTTGAIANLYARLDLQNAPFVRKLGESERALYTSGQQMERSGEKVAGVGNKLSVGLTLPLVAAGAAAIKTSMDFETTFSRMQGLAGVSADEVAGLRDEVLSLSGETTRSPQELAESLYFIRSAGISGQTALDTLEQSAKAAAAGLGSTVDVADAVTSAINAYGAENLSAAEATDVLTATVREGKAEASSFTPVFGRLLPVAKELGVSFDQVGAGLAYLTRTTGDASMAGTQLAGIMRKLLVPSQAAREQLDEMGLSADSLRQMVREQGLLATLEELESRAGGGVADAFQKLFEDADAVTGALQIVGDESGAVQATFANLEGSTGATDSAFAKFAETAGFKNAQAFAKLQETLIELGDTLVPIATDIASAIGRVVGVFSDLDPAAQKIVIAFGAIAAASGPMLSIGGNMMTMWGKVTQQLAATSTSGDATVRSLGRIGTALQSTVAVAGAAASAWAAYQVMVANARAEGARFADGMSELIMSFDPGEASPEEFGQRIEHLLGDMSAMKDELDGIDPRDFDYRLNLVEQIEGGQRQLSLMRDMEEQYVALAGAVGISETAALEFLVSQANLGVVYKDSEGAITGYTDAQAEMVAGTTDAYGATEELVDQVAQLKSNMESMIGLNVAYSDQIIALEEAYAGMTEQVLENGSSLDFNSEQGRNNLSMVNEMVTGIMSTATAYADQTGDVEGAANMLGVHRQRLIDNMTQMGFNREEVEAYINQLGLTPDTINTTFGIDTAGAKAQLDALLLMAANIARAIAGGAAAAAASAAASIFGGSSAPSTARSGGRSYGGLVAGLQAPGAYDPALASVGASSPSSGRSGRGRDIVIPLVVDGREVARAITPAARHLDQE